MTRRMAAAASVALGLVVVVSLAQPDRVHLVTGDPASYTFGADGAPMVQCSDLPMIGTLIADADVGTTFQDGQPAKWLPGYSGRRVGSEVEVLDWTGKVVATTGRKYQMYLTFSDGQFICDVYPCDPRCPIEGPPPSPGLPASKPPAS